MELFEETKKQYDHKRMFNYYLDKLSDKFEGKLMLSRKDVANTLSMSESTLYRNMQKEADLPPFKKIGGGHYYFPVDGVAKWMAKQAS